MKTQNLTIYLLILLFSVILFLFIKFHEMNEEVTYLHREVAVARTEAQEVPREKIDLIGIMKDNLYFADKLYFAGQEENWELAEFYHHEIEEGMEQVIDRQLYYDGFDITKLSKNMFWPPFEKVKASIEKKDKAVFEREYQMLVRSCNACHIASDHGFVKVTVPEGPTVSNQSFKK